MSPKTRTRTATAPLYSSRKTRSMATRLTVWAGTLLLDVGIDWTDFDWQRQRPGGFAAPFEGGVQVRRLDDNEAADVLLALGIRAVGDHGFALLKTHRRGGASDMQTDAEDPGASSLHLLAEGVGVAHDGVQDLRWRRIAIGLVDAEQIARHAFSG